MERDKKPLGVDLNPTTPAIIFCIGKPTQNLTIFFCEDNAALPANIIQINDATTSAYLYVPAEQYPWYVDILRNEKPVYALLFEEPEAIIVSTSDESVGEGEKEIFRWLIPK